MRFGNVFRKAIGFLGDGANKLMRFSQPIRGAAKAFDSLGIASPVSGFVDKGLGVLQRGAEGLKAFGEMSPKQQAERIGSLAGEKAGQLIGKGLGDQGLGRGIGQMGGNFLSQGLQRLLG